LWVHCRTPLTKKLEDKEVAHRPASPTPSGDHLAEEKVFSRVASTGFRGEDSTPAGDLESARLVTVTDSVGSLVIYTPDFASARLNSQTIGVSQLKKPVWP